MDLFEILKNNKKLIEYVDNSHYADIAEDFEELEVEDQHIFFENIPTDVFADVLVECNADVIIKVVEYFSVEEIIKIVSNLMSDDAVDVLGYATFGKQKAILQNMKLNDKVQFRTLLGYEKDSAGGIMSTEFIALKADLSVTDAVRKLREIEHDSDDYFDVIYIVDANKKLVGHITLKELVLSHSSTIISEIMDTFVVSVKASDDQEDVADLVQKYDLSAIPVVNNKENILGIITVDDVIDVLIEEQEEDYLKFAGVMNDPETEDTVISSIKARLPWLCINLVTAFLASFVVSRFDSVIDQVVALAVAMPIVAGMGGNAGTQALSVMIRNIAVNDASLGSEWKKVSGEVGVGLVNGIITGSAAGLVLSTAYDNYYLGIVLLCSMVGNMILAGIVGFTVPLILKRLNFDPALASSIFITTATDIFGFFLFLGLATVFLPLLI
ncbi:MAG: magnesium transporter [Bacilli bacterium]